MEKGQFVDVGDFDDATIDLTAAPQTADYYLKQVMKQRRRDRGVVRCDNSIVPLDVPHTSKSVPVQKKDPRAADESWQKSKCEEFRQKRDRLLRAIASKKVIGDAPELLHMNNETYWHQIILESCLPQYQHRAPSFPCHVGTPPTVRFVASFSAPQVCSLLEFMGDWAQDEGLNRPIREWIFALMLVVDLPLLHDVVASLRSVAKLARQARSTLDTNRKDEIAEYSFFIAVISGFFGQQDLKD